MRIAPTMVLFSSVLVLAGCTAAPVMTTTSTPTNQVQGKALQGRVHGGQQPIVGAQVYLYAADATGYGHASDSLLSAPGYVTTNSSGNFTITSDYTCPSASTQVYLYSVGGNPGSGANSAAGLLAGLGSCGSLSSSTFIFMNEVSTIATAYSIAGFATDAAHVSSSGSALALTGVANAFGTIPNLETLSTGVALTATPGGNGTVPQSEINTLANILAACINSTGPSSTACSTLLASALSSGTTGTQPTDTATAAINIAHNPWANISALYGLQGSSPPFVPDLSAAPNDYTIGVYFTGDGGSWGGFGGPAVDASGNLWITGGFSGCGVGELLVGGTWSSFTPVTGGGISDWCPSTLAIDESGNVWLDANWSENEGVLIELKSSGSVLSCSVSQVTSNSCSYISTNFGDPLNVAVDGSGNIWSPTLNNNIWEYIPGTGFSNTTGYGGGGINQPNNAAVDASGDVWTGNDGDSSVSKFSSSGSPLSPSTGYTGGGLVGGGPIAIDATGNVWATSPYQAQVSEFSSGGMALSGMSGFTGGGLNQPQGIAIDGASNVWTANWASAAIVELNSSGAIISGSNGFKASSNVTSGFNLSGPFAIAIDGSGNAWVLNNQNNYIVQVVGVATPVVTPISANLKSPYGAHAVNRP